jgi:hypothetical protein
MPNLSAPITRGELREELALFRETLVSKSEFEATVAKLATKAELREAIAGAIAPLATKAELREAIAGAIAPLATKVELELWGGALDAKISNLDEAIRSMPERLAVENARHFAVIYEAVRRDISVVDEKYADLPRRVTDLESSR